MKYPILICSDLHLTMQPAAEYRWGLFPWLNEQCQKHGVKTLLCLGDLTDAKDGHSAALVNRIVNAINALPVDDVRILAGNHDWLKRGEEFFRFLNFMPHVQFITEPTGRKDGPASTLFLPYTKTPADDWNAIKDWDYDYIFMHQTIKGAIASNGQQMDGEPISDFYSNGFQGYGIFSGDIHVPQKIGAIEYVGSPFHVHFGDKFKPRCILIKNAYDNHDLHFQTISRVTVKASGIDALRNENLRAGDQVKLRMELSEGEKHDWHKIKREALQYLAAQGVAVHGVELLVKPSVRRVVLGDVEQHSGVKKTPYDEVVGFVDAESLSGDVLTVGLELI